MKILYPFSKAFVRSMLVASLVLTSAPAYAAEATTGKSVTEQVETKISREEALEIAAKFVTPGKDYKGPQVTKRTWYGPNQPMVWEINWHRQGKVWGYINIVINADTGEVLQFNYHDDGVNVSLPPKVSYEDAVKKAIDVIEKFYPGSSSQFIHYRNLYEEDYGTVLRNPRDTYTIPFVKLVNGVPFVDEMINISIDGNGDLRGFSYQPAKQVNFQKKDGILSEANAMKKLADNLTMRLAYGDKNVYFYDNKTKKPEMVLKYVPSIPLYMLDATTMTPLDYTGKPIVTPTQNDKPLGEKEADNTPPRTTPVTEKEALEILTSFVKLPEGVNVTYIEKRDEPYVSENPTWHINLEYQLQDGKGIVGWTGAVIDSVTGRILSFNMNTYMYELKATVPDAKPEIKLSRDEAKETALTFVKKLNKTRLHELYWMTQNEPVNPNESPFYHFSFERRVNGILVEGQMVNVTISAETGEIVSYTESWRDTDFPEVKDVMSAEKAKEIFLKDSRLVLEYRLVGDMKLYEAGMENKEAPAALEAKLVYRLDHPYPGNTYLDAKSGQFISYQTGKPADKKAQATVVPADIKGHFAEKELLHLVKLKAIPLEDGKVLPNKIVTRGEFFDIFLRVLNYYPEGIYLEQSDRQPTFTDVPKGSKYYAAVEWAVMQKWIQPEGKTFEPDRPITREEAAEFVVSALGFGKLAELNNLFNLPFADKAEITKKGHVAIAHELGLMKGDGQRFNPKGELNRAQIAILLFRLLGLQQEFQVRPYY